MFHLSDFLAKYKNLGLNERLSKEAFVESVNLVLGKTLLKMEDVSIRNNTAYLKVPSLLKSEIRLRSGEILENARAKIGKNFSVREIR